MATLADLAATELTADLTWREAEMAVLKKQLALSSNSGLQQKVLLRATLAMTYAHYEGFCKFALQLYIDNLKRLRLRRTELAWPLAAYSLADLQSRLRQTEDRREFFDIIMSELNSELNAAPKFENLPDTSNLWPGLLEKCLGKLNLDSTNVAASRTILESLVRNRNHIAHGKNLSISNLTELENYTHAALLAMHEVAIGVSNALEMQTYRRHTQTTTTLAHAQ